MSQPGNRVYTASSKQHRFHLLDAIRGLAALLVVAYHAPQDFGRLVPFRSGFLAVDLFFALSGFVIAFSYERRLREGLAYRNFIVARLIRLYPVYLIGTVAAVVAGVAAGHLLSAPTFPLQLLLALLLLPDLFHGARAAVYPLDFPAWSLLCEVLSNVAYAAIVFWRHVGQWLLCLCTLAAAIYMVLWVHRAGTVDSGSVLQTFNMGLARVAYSFGAGVLVFRYFHAKHRERLSGAAAALLACVLSACVLLALATRLTQTSAAQLVTVLFVFPVLIYLGSLVSLHGMWSSAATFLGDTSYPIYLLHIPFFTLFRGRGMHRLAVNHPQAGTLVAFASIAFLLLLSWVTARWIDLPLRRRLTATYNGWASHAA